MKPILKTFLLFALMTCSACNNLFLETANKTSDKALLFAANEYINRGEFTQAIAQFDLMTPTFLAKRETKVIQASAYAGRCGLELIPMIMATSEGTGNLLTKLVSAMRAGTADKQADCVEAENIMKEIGSEAVRDSNENFFMIFLGFAKIGLVLNKLSDADLDGVPDAGFDPCASIPDADANELVTGMAIALTSLAGAGASLSGIPTDSITAVCDALPAAQNFCAITDTSNVTADMRLGIKTMVNESTSIGLGTNCTGDYTVCFCL